MRIGINGFNLERKELKDNIISRININQDEIRNPEAMDYFVALLEASLFKSIFIFFLISYLLNKNINNLLPLHLLSK